MWNEKTLALGLQPCEEASELTALGQAIAQPLAHLLIQPLPQVMLDLLCAMEKPADRESRH